ncbi:hypothetical protein IJF81_04100 [bacterium]|nr:hypothetical protein [bacterium]
MDPINFGTNSTSFTYRVKKLTSTNETKDTLPADTRINIPFMRKAGAKPVSDVNANQNPWVILEKEYPLLKLAGITTGRGFEKFKRILGTENINDITEYCRITESNVESFMNSPEMKILGNLA